MADKHWIGPRPADWNTAWPLRENWFPPGEPIRGDKVVFDMNNNGRYIEVDGKPQIENDLIAWSKWLEKADRVVKKTEIGVVKVSTVFLSLDHQFGNGPPLLYETVVFGGELDQDCERYSTREEALQGHVRWCNFFLIELQMD